MYQQYNYDKKGFRNDRDQHCGNPEPVPWAKLLFQLSVGLYLKVLAGYHHNRM